jgi:hypothetical protein
MSDLDRVKRQTRVVDRVRRARDVEDVIDLVVEEWLRQVVVDEHEVIAMRDVLDVLKRARVEVVNANHLMAKRQ